VGASPTAAAGSPRALIVSRSTAGPVLTLTIACENGSAGAVCSGPITLTSKGGKKVGAASYSVATGKQVTVTVPLDATGKKLLAKSYKLAATLSLAGTTALSRTVHFHYRLVDAPVAYTWAFDATHTRAEQLSVSQIPAGGIVKVICHGGGCPFAHRSFSPDSSRKVSFGPPVTSSHLRPGAVLTLEITDTNYVGKVLIFDIFSGRQPTVRAECLVPGAAKPSKCA
jgi:hypothetical protein